MKTIQEIKMPKSNVLLLHVFSSFIVLYLKTAPIMTVSRKRKKLIELTEEPWYVHECICPCDDIITCIYIEK